MIKNFKPREFDDYSILPSYVTNIRRYTLTAEIKGGYTITLARLQVGDSVSAGNLLTHALFESFNDHGRRMAINRTRVSGVDREFLAVKNAMVRCGVEFAPVTPRDSEEMLNALGYWFCRNNEEIERYAIMSQRCH